MQLDRREFLKLSGFTIAGGSLVTQAKPQAAHAAEEALGILYDTTKCIGCRACQMACKRWNQLPPEMDNVSASASAQVDGASLYDAPLGLSDTTWTLIKLRKTSATNWHFMNYQCMHCTDAACVTVCPTGALYKDPHGFTGYDQSKCIGCGYCTQFCPYGVPHLDVESTFTGKAKAAKCTFCQDRVQSEIGGPFCATICPVEALTWGPREKLLAQAKERITHLHEQGISNARLYGDRQAGGLGRISILLDSPDHYNLPADPASPLVSRLWQNIVQVLGTVAIGVSGLGAIVAFLISRSNIRMEEVE